MFRPNEQILEIKPRPAEPSRKIMKENREADSCFFFKEQQNFRGRFFSEQNFGKAFFGGGHILRRAFVGRERADQFENERNIGNGGRTDCELFHRSLRHWMKFVDFKLGTGLDEV